MRRTIVSTLAAALAAAPGAVAAQGAVRSVHEAWELRCSAPAGGQAERCALMQTVVDEKRANVGVTVFVVPDGGRRLLRVVAPLGALLPPGLGLKVDGADVASIAFVRCVSNGCIAEAPLDEGLLARLRGGTTATFVVFQTRQDGVAFSFSLKGFAGGYESLQ